MTRNVISVGPSTCTRSCMSLMSEKKIRQQQAGIARATRAIWTEVGSAAVADGGGQPLNSRHPSLTGHCGGRP